MKCQCSFLRFLEYLYFPAVSWHLLAAKEKSYIFCTNVVSVTKSSSSIILSKLVNPDNSTFWNKNIYSKTSEDQRKRLISSYHGCCFPYQYFKVVCSSSHYKVCYKMGGFELHSSWYMMTSNRSGTRSFKSHALNGKKNASLSKNLFPFKRQHSNKEL